MTNMVEAYTSHALTAQYEDLTSEAYVAIRTFLLDSIGVGIAGANVPLASLVRQSAFKWGNSGDANVWGLGGLKTTATNAAFLNGFQIHCQEYDCVHEGAVVHPMATILSSMMADIDQNSQLVSGRELAIGLAVGVDLAVGIGLRVRSPLKFFRPANAGLFGAVLGIARLRRMSVPRTKNALGFALSFNAGTMQAHLEGKAALPLQIGNAARSAIMACDLAESGIEGPQDSLEGNFGYFALFEDDVMPPSEYSSLGKIWRITEVSHKPFPTGRAAQGGIVLMKELRAKGVLASNIEKITLLAPPLIERLVGRPIVDNMSPSYARLCFQFLGAVSLLDGNVALSDFGDCKFNDNEIIALGERIQVISNGSSDHSAFTPQVLTSHLKNGKTIIVDTKTIYGSPANPMSKEDHLQKFQECVDFGFGNSRDEIATRLIELVENLEEIEDASILSKLANGQEIDQ